MKPTSSPQEMIGAKVNKADIDALRRVAKKNDRSLSAEIRQAIRCYLASEEGRS